MPDATKGAWGARLQALFVTFLWSTSWVLIKLGLGSVAPLTFAGLRYTLAFGVLAAMVLVRPTLRRQVVRLSAADGWRLAGLGLVMISITQGALFVALAFLPAVTLSLILSFTPAAVALASASVLGERLNGRQWLGLGGFLVGATLYFLPVRVPPHALGLLAATLGLLANAAGSLQGRSVNRRQHLPAIIVTTVSMGVGGLLLLATGWLIEGPPRLAPSDWLIVGWLAMVNTAFAFTLWNHTLRRLHAVESSLINNTMLVQIALLAWLFLGETITPREGAGLALAVVGIVAVQWTADASPRVAGTARWLSRPR